MSQSGIYFEGTAAPDVETLSDNVGTKVSPDGTFNIGLTGTKSAYVLANSAGHTLSVFGSANYLVDATNAPFSTIQSAITQAIADGASASAQKMIVIRPGTYTENIINTANGINLVSWDRFLTERGLAANSAVRTPSVKIVGGITTSAEMRLLGIAIVPPSTVAALTINGAVNVAIADCKIEITNAAMIAFTNTPTVQISRTDCIPTTASVTDVLFSTGTDSITISIDDCNLSATTATSALGNFYIYNSFIGSKFIYASVGTIYFEVRNSDMFASGANVLITGGASNIIQIEASNSSLRSGSTALFNFTNTSSYIHAYNCFLYGTRNTGTALDIALISCAAWSNVDGIWEPISTAFGNAVFHYIQNTGSTSAGQIILAPTAAGDVSTLWGIASTRGFCQGIDNSDSDKLKLTTTNSEVLDPSTGTTVWDVENTNIITSYRKPLQAQGGWGEAWTVVSANYAATIADVNVGVDTSGGAHTIWLPDAPPGGFVFYIKDLTGNALANNITVTTVAGTPTFDGSTSYVMNTNRQVNGFKYINTTYYYQVF